ncbi:O-antigen ligase family protein [Mycetocola spongiae]|uniref:O-antigen ligase family protein n=1 Tax=Mycetocola spongiae TaxID=2859226 RepID=UPI001CF2B5E8|nr:exopolysaccharide production protein [Mycetocola spongiae]UCR90328.1 exopolysaccharide production protein [Mycetocola spongiae]
MILPRRPGRDALLHLRTLVTGAPGAQALAVTIIAWSFCVPLTRAFLGWAGVAAALITLMLLAGLLLVARRDYIEWGGAVPLTLILFLAWCALSVVWSSTASGSLVGAAYQCGFAFLGVAVALSRDTIQIVRAVGTAMRILLTASLLLEIFSGILIDVPIKFLRIDGAIAAGGPIQGVFGTRNFLAFAAMIALVTFVIEWRTRSVPRGVTIYSAIIALSALLLSRSPVMLLVALMLLVATAALYGIRKARADRRSGLQWTLLSVTGVSIALIYFNRVAILTALNNNGEFLTRYRLWIQMWRLIPVNLVEGWGWVGIWRADVAPYNTINYLLVRNHRSGLNGFLDVYIQVGIVGILLFLALVVTAFIRSWLLASNRRTVTYTWPALIMVILIVTSVAESFVLTSGGWLLLVICATQASRSTGWLLRFRETRRSMDPVPRE